MVKAIIPCAGYGTRMGMNPNQSKELLIDPITNEPIIKWHLDLCARYNIKPIIITRRDKEDLIEYIKKNTDALLHILNEVNGEWMDTVLTSKHMWSERNILMLPDTRFNGIGAIRKIKELLFKEENDIVFATHYVDNLTKWGAVGQVGYNNIIYSYCEKPTFNEPSPGLAWGLIGFKPDAGEDLFKNMRKKGTWFNESTYTIKNISLNYFTDLTRNGTIEKYE